MAGSGLRRRILCSLTALASFTISSSVHAADDKWIETKSAHFAVVSNASERATRSLAWQLEQIRSVLAALWPWARVDLNRPLGIVAVKDEGAMRALAPEYWERKTDVRPASVWVSGPDGPYIALRTDVQSDDRMLLNPHLTVYYSYVSLVLQSSATSRLPVWLMRGLAGFMSNTIVRDNFILLGAPIPWHVQRLRGVARMPLAELFATTNQSRVFTDGDRMAGFDAQSWAVVHYLMFGKQGAMRSAFDQYLSDVFQGKDPAAAQAVFGRIQELDAAVQNYIQQQLFTYSQVAADLAVKREAFESRPLPPAESAAARAALQVAMGHHADARALIDLARKADASSAASYVSEGLMFEQQSKVEEARQAYAQAVERGSTNAWAHYRLAALTWQPQLDRQALAEIEKHLTRAIALNDRLAPAFAFLGDVRAQLDPKGNNALPVVRRAIALEPGEPSHRLATARILWTLGQEDAARGEAETALALSRSDQERDAARRLLQQMVR